jgi:Tol biopolymer transport system component
LRWLADSSTSHDTMAVASPASPATTPHRRRLAIAALAMAALGGVVTWATLRSLSPAAATPFAAHLTLTPPDGIQPVDHPETPNFALSPDGRTLCFVAARGGALALFLRRLDSFEATKIEGTDGGSAPFWSSDGEWIAFSARGKLWKTRAAGPAVPEQVGDTILFNDRPPGRQEILRVSASGGTPVKATTKAPGESRHLWARLLPDGRHFLHHIAAVDSLERRLVLASLDAPGSSLLLRNVSQTALVAPDQLAFVRDGKLLVQHFDAAKGVMVGEPALIANDVGYFTPTARARYDAANGVFVYRTETSVGRLVVTDRQGKSRVIDDRGPYDDFSLSVSPDGRQAAVTVLDRATSLGEIWIYDLARGVRDRLTNEGGLALSPIWSPDGKSMVYSAAGQRLPHLMRRVLATTTSVDLKAVGNFQFGGSFTPDGSTVFYTQQAPGTKADIYRIDLRSGKSEPVLAGGFNEQDPRVSPDGHWMAFVSDETGAPEVYLQSLGDKEVPRIRVSTSGGSYPCWRGDGRELLYLSPQKGVVSVVPRTSNDWTDTVATTLFAAPPDTLRFAVIPNGQSLVLIEGSPGPEDAVFHVIVGYHSR